MNLINIPNDIFLIFLEYSTIRTDICKSIRVKVNFCNANLIIKLKQFNLQIQDFGDYSFYYKLLNCIKLTIPLSIKCKETKKDEETTYHKAPITGFKIGRVNTKLCNFLVQKSEVFPTLKHILRKCPLLTLGFFIEGKYLIQFFVNLISTYYHQEGDIQLRSIQSFFGLSDNEISELKTILKSKLITPYPRSILLRYLRNNYEPKIDSSEFLKINTLLNFVESLNGKEKILQKWIGNIKIKDSINRTIKYTNMFITQSINCDWENKNEIIQNYKIAQILFEQLQKENEIYIDQFHKH